MGQLFRSTYVSADRWSSPHSNCVTSRTARFGVQPRHICDSQDTVARVRTLLTGASGQDEAQTHARVIEIVQAFHEVGSSWSRLQRWPSRKLVQSPRCAKSSSRSQAPRY